MQFHSDFVTFSLKNKKVIISWLTNSVIAEKKIPGELTFIFTSDAKIKQINKKFLDHNYATDIITFPYSDATENTISGDIYISIDTVKYNASIYGVSFVNELHRVMIHGILHLCGYNDQTEKQKEKIRKKEDHYLDKLASLTGK